MAAWQTAWAKPLGVRQSHCRLVDAFASKGRRQRNCRTPKEPLRGSGMPRRAGPARSIKLEGEPRVSRFKACVLLWAVLAAMAALPAPAAERFPQPEFETNHVVPEPTKPAARNPFLPYQDVAVLALALSLSSYFVLRRRSRRAVFVLMVCCLVYFGFWKKGCICPVGSTQNILLALSDATYVVPLSVVLLFLLPLVFALFFGRVFCAAVCPLGAIQDAVVLKPVRVPRWLEQVLGLLRHLYLGLAVLLVITGAGFMICRYDPFVAFFRRSGEVPMLMLGAAFLGGGIFIARPYCRFLCPYGVLLSWMSRLSKWHASITPDTCIQCRLCEDACPFGAINFPNTDTPDREGRTAGIRRLGLLLLIVLPFVVVLFGWVGSHLDRVLAPAHPTVKLAQQVALEQSDPTVERTLRSEAFRGAGTPMNELFAEEESIRRTFRVGGSLIGGWVGLIYAWRLVLLSLRRTRADYETDRGACLSCARCFASCPREQLRLGNPVDIDI